MGQAARTQLVDGLFADLLQDVRFLRVYMQSLSLATYSLRATIGDSNFTMAMFRVKSYVLRMTILFRVMNSPLCFC